MWVLVVATTHMGEHRGRGVTVASYQQTMDSSQLSIELLWVKDPS